jgi:hypothetical protein
MAISAARWQEIKFDRIADAAGRLGELPLPYQQWVRKEAARRGLPVLALGADLGVGEVQTYDALIAKCEREIKARENAPEGDDAA